jgi:hypothetical protein
MAAPQKNLNAQKWTEESIIPYLSKMNKAAHRKKNLFIGQQLKKLKLYPDIWSYWKRKFSDNEDIMERMDLIEGAFESNVVNAGLYGDIPARVAILTLRNAHGWRNNPAREEQEIKVVKMDTASGKTERGENNAKRA